MSWVRERALGPLVLSSSPHGRWLSWRHRVKRSALPYPVYQNHLLAGRRAWNDYWRCPDDVAD